MTGSVNVQKIIDNYKKDQKNVKRFLSRNWFTLWFSIGLWLFFTGCGPALIRGFDRQYDYSTIFMDPAEDDLVRTPSGVYRIQTITQFRINGETHTARAAGLATALNPYCLLTAKHVVKIESFRVATPFGIIDIPISDTMKIEERSYIVLDDGSRIEIDTLYADDIMDFAVLKGDKALAFLPFPVGDSDRLRIGNLSFLAGNFQTGFSIRFGRITQVEFVTYGPGGGVADIRKDVFSFSAITVEGDSGSPIFGIRDGKPELIGMVTFIFLPARGLGYGLKINPIIQSFKKFESKSCTLK